MDRTAVAHYQNMLVFVVLEEVEDPFFLHEPTDEVEVAFLVLDAESAFAVGVQEGETVVLGGDARFLEDGLDDLLRGRLLKNAAVFALGKKIDGWNDFGFIKVISAAHAGIFEFPHDAVEMTVTTG
jgi:hypothetical protein